MKHLRLLSLGFILLIAAVIACVCFSISCICVAIVEVIVLSKGEIADSVFC